MEEKSYHRWGKKTREYCGTIKYRLGGEACEPKSDVYQYEEYTPPPYPYKDGYYVVSTINEPQKRHIVRKEGDKALHLRKGLPNLHWGDCTVIAEVEGLNWIGDKPDETGKW